MAPPREAHVRSEAARPGGRIVSRVAVAAAGAASEAAPEVGFVLRVRAGRPTAAR